MTGFRTNRLLWLGTAGLAGLAFASAPRTTQATKPICMASLTAPSEGVVFDLQSCGCFGCSHYVLRYTAGPTPRIVVSELPERYGRVWDVLYKILPPPEKSMAAVTLTRREVLGLDRLLGLYRTLSDYGCTQRDLVKVRHYSGGWKVRSEEYLDSSCRSDVLVDADPRDLRTLGKEPDLVVSLDRLIQLAADAQQRSVPVVPYTRLPRKDTPTYWEAQSIRTANLRKRAPVATQD